MHNASARCPCLRDGACHHGRVAKRGRRWLVAGVAGWGVLLLVLAYVSASRDEPTVREQRAIDQALERVHTATGQLLAAAGPGVVAEIAPDRVVEGCRITTVRRGANARTDITLYPPAGQAPAVLARIAAALPAAYRAEVLHAEDGSTRGLEAEAGEFVGVRGEVSEDGVVTLSAATGCRPVAGSVDPNSQLLTVPPHPEQQRVLAAVGGPRVEFVEARPAVRCPGGAGMAQTRVLTLGDVPGDVAAALKPILAGATVLRAGPDVYAYLAGDTSVVLRTVDDGVRVAATTGCA